MTPIKGAQELVDALKEDCRENFDGELETKLAKVIGYHVPRVLMPEQLVRSPLNFIQKFKKHSYPKECSHFF